MSDVDAQLKSDLNLPTDSGALLQSVVPGGPADEAGLQAGSGTETSDGVKAGRRPGRLDRRQGRSTARTRSRAPSAASSPATRSTIEYYRGGDKHTATVTLGGAPGEPRRRHAGPAADQQGQEQSRDSPFPLP